MQRITIYRTTHRCHKQKCSSHLYTDVAGPNLPQPVEGRTRLCVLCCPVYVHALRGADPLQGQPSKNESSETSHKAAAYTLREPYSRGKVTKSQYFLPESLWARVRNLN